MERTRAKIQHQDGQELWMECVSWALLCKLSSRDDRCIWKWLRCGVVYCAVNLMQNFRRNRLFLSSWNSWETFIQSTRHHIPEDSRFHSNWRVNPLSQPCDITYGSLHWAHSTSRSRERGYQRHSFVLHTETYQMRKPLYLSRSQARIQHQSNFEKLWSIYLWNHSLRNWFIL